MKDGGGMKKLNKYKTLIFSKCFNCNGVMVENDIFISVRTCTS